MIYLNDILHLSNEEIENSKIALNMGWAGVSHLTRWYESDESGRDVDFSYYSHRGNSNQRNFTKIGQNVFGFVQLPHNNHWLFITAGEITSIPDRENVGACGHKEIEKYQALIGRLIIKVHDKPNAQGRYIFNMSTLIGQTEVVEILPTLYEPIQFSGYENVHLTYKQLKLIASGERYSRYKDALLNVKGIYCLTDKKSGKLYIGSAYGQNGIIQRWDDYLNTSHGGNVGLKELYEKEGEVYFVENIEFTLLEFFDKRKPDKDIIHRENYWKEALGSRIAGYNHN